MENDAHNGGVSTSTSQVSTVDRPELAPILRALSQLADNQQDQWLFALTGFPGSGGKSAVHHLLQEVERQNPAVSHLRYSIPNLLTPADNSIYGGITTLLRAIAQAVGAQLAEPTDPDQNPPGEATLKNQVRTLYDQWHASQRPLFLVLEGSDASKETRLLMRVLERVLLTRLVSENAQRPSVPLVLVVAGKHELRWSDLTPAVTPVPLQPFSAAQTAQQLGISLRQAQVVQAVSGGLPVANDWLRADKRLAALPLSKTAALPADSQPHAWPPAQPLFEEVFTRFVAPFLGQDALLADAIKAVALLDDAGQGFNVTELALALQAISYVQGRYTATGKAAYYGEIDRMYGLGLISPGDDGRFRLEPHLRRLLDLWNQYTQPTADATNRARIVQIRADLAAATRKGVPAAGPHENVANSVTAVPVAEDTDDLERIYHQIINYKPPPAPAGNGKPKSRVFVGRDGVRQEIANYLCRQTIEEVDIVFLQGSPGSGKTAVLGHLLNAARAAIQTVNPHQCSPLLVTTQLYDKEDDPSPENPDYQNPTPGLIDLEYSPENRFGSIRRMLRYAIVDSLVEEQLRTEHRTKADLKPGELKKLRDAQKDRYFAEYGRAEDRWDQKRGQIRNCKPFRWQAIQAQREEIAQLQSKLDQEFLKACSAVATSRREQIAERQRILVVFDTFDYPVRSGLSARRFVSQVAAQLAGDYFFLIACRPPIGLEKTDPYIDGDLRNYFPDDLHDQARVIDLDAAEHRLTVENVQDYYRNRAWYKKARDLTFRVQQSGLVIGNRDDLALEITHLFFQYSGLPVLLDLLEYFVGVHNGPNDGQITNDPNDLSNLATEEFGDKMIEGLLRHKLSGLVLEPYQTALLLMSVADRRISRNLLAGYTPPAPDEYIPGICEQLNDRKETRDPDLDAKDIWQAMLALADTTLVKLMPSTMSKMAYKLHDYVVGLFDHYVQTQAAATAYPLLKQREHILFAVLCYMNKLAEVHKPKSINGEDNGNKSAKRPSPDLSDDAKKEWEREQERRLRIYQAARSVFLYYAIRLAAVQYQDETNHNRPLYRLPDIDVMINASAEQEPAQAGTAVQLDKAEQESAQAGTAAQPDKLDRLLATLDAQPDKLVVIRSRELLVCLKASLYEALPRRSDETARFVFGYLLGKVVREVSQHMEYGLAQMLLQDARYYLQDQMTSNYHWYNLTLPLVKPSDDPRGRFAPARRLYYAAILTWEHASRQYATGDPWLAEQHAGTSHLREWRSEAEWRAICALLQLNEETYQGSQRTYQGRYADWLRQAGYTRQAHDAYALLTHRTDGAEYVRLMIDMANLAIDNPIATHYYSGEGRLNSQISGLEAARKYLNKALAVCLDRSQRVRESLIAEVHHTFGYLYRILDQLDWQIAPTAIPLSAPAAPDDSNVVDTPIPSLKAYANWGAQQHYNKAMQLLEPSQEAEDRLQYAIALNGYSYVLAILGQVDLAATMCEKGIDLLAALYEPLAEEDALYRGVSDALGRAHSTRGGIGWYLARRPQVYDRNAPIATTAYRAALASCDKARLYFEPTNRQWHAKLDLQKSNSNYWLAAVQSDDELIDVGRRSQAQQQMLAAVPSMGRTIRFLLPKDRADGYRRFGVILFDLARRGMALPGHNSTSEYLRFLRLKDRTDGYRQLGVIVFELARRGMTLPGHNSTSEYPGSLKLFIESPDVARRLLEQQNAAVDAHNPIAMETVIQAYVSMQRGYDIATKTPNRQYKILLTQDSVDLLATFAGAQTAADFYKHRLDHLELHKRLLHGPDECEMMGRAELTIGFALLHEARDKKDDLDAANALSMEAAAHIKKGFDLVNTRSIGNQVRLLQDIARLHENLDLFTYEALVTLYSDLTRHNFGPPWRAVIEELNWRIVRAHASALLPLKEL